MSNFDFEDKKSRRPRSIRTQFFLFAQKIKKIFGFNHSNSNFSGLVYTIHDHFDHTGKFSRFSASAYPESSSNDALILLGLIICSTAIFIYQFALGVLTAKFHQIIGSLHYSLTILAFIFSYVAIRKAVRGPSGNFTYGYRRFEILSSFANSAFVIFAACFLVFHSLHDVIESDDKNHSHDDHEIEFVTIIPKIFELILNLSVLYGFRNYIFFRKENNSLSWFSLGEQASSHFLNVHSVTTILVFGTLKILKTILLESTSFLEHCCPELILSVIVAAFAVMLVKNVMIVASKVLIQALPFEGEALVDRVFSTIEKQEGVKELRDLHYWALTPQDLVIDFRIVCEEQKAELAQKQLETELLKTFKYVCIEVIKATS